MVASFKNTTMKKQLQHAFYLIFGLLLMVSCSEEKTGKVAAVTPYKIKPAKQQTPIIEKVEEKDSQTMEIKRVKPLPPPPAPPIPYPGPEPDPHPWPVPPPPYPEPVPIPTPDPVFDIPEIQAQFPGGTAALMKYIQNEMVYPEIDKEQNNQGKVYMQFIVEIDGSITSINVARGVSPTIDKEAKRVIRTMPNWIPGEQRGKKVRSKMTLPLTFTLQ